MARSTEKLKIILVVAAFFLAGAIITGAVFSEQVVQFGKTVGKTVEKKAIVYAQTAPVYFLPEFPERLKFLVSELAIASQELENLGIAITEQVQRCGCQNMTSECFDCRPGVVIGDPCPDRRKIEGKQFDIDVKLDQISFLRRLLQKEMAIAERELETLPEQYAQDLRNSATALLGSSEEIIGKGRDIWRLSHSHQANLNRCQAQCSRSQPSFGSRACIDFQGQQKPATLRFSAGVFFDDLSLGEMRIRNVNLGLPAEIRTSDLPYIDSFSVPMPALQIEFPETPVGQAVDLSRQRFVFRPPFPRVPRLPTLNFSCPTLPRNLTSTYQWPATSSPDSVGILENEFEQYSQTFDSLRGYCLGLAAHKYGSSGSPQYLFSSEYVNCHVPISVRQTIINMCEAFQDEYKQCLQRSEPASPCAPPPPPCSGEDLPPFDGTLPTAQVEVGQQQIAPNQTIANFAASTIDCPASPPTIPKIRFPKIVIPDIRLPRFKLMPFFDVKLPNLIFEDLQLLDLELCNLNKCANLLPEPRLRMPVLGIPKVSALTVPLTGFCTDTTCVDLGELVLADLRFPPIPLNLRGWGNLLTPEIELGSINFPRPKFEFAFRAFDIDFLNLLLGLLRNLLSSIPPVCFAPGIPLIIQFDDIVFNWPVFPEIPEIPGCRQVNDFCRDVKSRLGKADIAGKVRNIENTVNKEFEEKIQRRLDRAGQEVNQKIASSTQEQLEDRARKIEQEINRHVRQQARVSDGKVQIPALTISLDPLQIPRIYLADLAGLPPTIQIPWPANLKRFALTEPIIYSLPEIPLSNLNYRKEIEIKIPGFQLDSPIVTLNPLRGGCQAGRPSGGNPYNMPQIQTNLNNIGQIKNNIERTSKNIIDILR